MAHYDVDLLVLGGGAAGLTAAGTAANLGAKTMLVERDRLGGDCTWTGCVPSKTLLHVAALRANAQAFGAYADGAPAPPVDFAKVMGDVHQTRQEVYDEADDPAIFEGFGIEVVKGDARLTGPHAVHIDGAGGGRDVTFRMAILCTGGRAAPPPIDGLDATPYLTNEGLFEIDALPEHLVIVGGGPIGCEMGQAFRRLGSRVTVIDRADEILGRDDADHAAILRGVLEREGVQFRLGADVEKVEESEAGVRVTLSVDGKSETVEGDRLLIATGRTPNVEDLGLEAAGVAFTDKGITVDERCRTSQGHIWAAGDCTGEYALTHMSEHMAKQAVTNAILKVPAAIDRDGITWTTYTTPEVAQLGPTAAELDENNTDYVVYRFPYTKVDRAVTEHATDGHIKILATKWRGKILGASVVGERAGELISMLAVARKGGVSAREVSDTIIPYPTYGLGARRAADQYYIQKQFPVVVDTLKRVFSYRGTTPPPPDPDRVL
ncbi:dihydrolipoyl dehydrogenase family protein [Rubrivirga sp. IMCC45206]|uniref:dihydrolipoyl dehydrogenase family protein n=1 Tax=Rubrivirga sp. IMCC45206 TaxID=3391614 RepID=UPI00398FD861